MIPANEWMNNKRFLCGLMFIGIGAVAIYIAQDYPMGSALRMGPGYFPDRARGHHGPLRGLRTDPRSHEVRSGQG